MLKTDTSRSPKLTMPGAPKMDPELFSQDGGLRKHLEKVGPSMAAKSEEFSKLDSAWARYEFLRRVRIHSRYLLFYSIEIHTNRKKTLTNINPDQTHGVTNVRMTSGWLKRTYPRPSN